MRLSRFLWFTVYINITCCVCSYDCKCRTNRLERQKQVWFIPL